jgi:hypothetical protein
MKMNKNLGMLVLGLWLIMYGLIGILHLSFEGLPMLMAVAAIVAGALIIAGK